MSDTTDVAPIGGGSLDVELAFNMTVYGGRYAVLCVSWGDGISGTYGPRNNAYPELPWFVLTSSGRIGRYPDASYQVAVLHDFAAPGVYTVSWAVTQADGQSTPGSATIQVSSA